MNQQRIYQLKPNLWIDFINIGQCAYIELTGYRTDNTKVTSIFPIDIYTIEEAINEFEKYLNK